MAASVQELLLAAQAKQKKSPLTSLAEMINAGAAGYTKGVAQKKVNADAENSFAEADVRRQALIMKIIADKQAADAQAELRKRLEDQLAVQTETGVRERLGAVKEPGQPATPRAKVQETFKIGEDGKITSEIKMVEPKQPKYSPKEYVDPITKQKKTGRWDENTGKLETSSDDPIAEMSKPAADIGLTEAQKQVDKKFADDYLDFSVGGGYADVQKQLGQLNDVVSTLKGKGTDEKPAGVNATGKIGILPKGVRDIVSPEGSALQDRVEEVVQRNLRLILGGQFAQQEGAQLIQRAYNPRLGEAENIYRLKNLIRQIDQAARAKAEAGAYYEAHGTLKGFKGKIYRSANDFLSEYNDSDSDAAAPEKSGGLDATKKSRLEELRRKRDNGTLGK